MTEPHGTSERVVLRSAGDSVELRQLVPDDDRLYYDLIAYDPDHLRQYGGRTADRYPGVAAVRASIVNPDLEKPSRVRFGIWDKDIIVGSNNVTPYADGQAEIGSWVGKQHIGNRYAARGRLLLVSFAFEKLDIHRVYSEITIGNEASRRSVASSGLNYVGVVNGHWRFVIDKEEWARKTPRR